MTTRVTESLDEHELREFVRLRANMETAKACADIASATLEEERILLQGFLIRIKRSRGLQNGDGIAPNGDIIRNVASVGESIDESDNGRLRALPESG